MFKKFLSALGGDSNEKELKRLQPIVEEINALEAEFDKLSNEDLPVKTNEFKDRLNSGEDLDDLLPEAFATVRRAAYLNVGMRHFDVQLIGGIVLYEGRIAEMKTGEGKTLVATLPAYLNALTSEGVHVITVNDYLSKRDTQWMGAVYHALGLSVGCIQHESAFLFDPDYDSEDESWPHLRPVRRKEAYDADITYGTNNEFGFDYLRDNMVADFSQKVQREFNYAIVDEVDNILIDEARTPLIISGQAEESQAAYIQAERAVRKLERGLSTVELDQMKKELGENLSMEKAESEYDYIFDERTRHIHPTSRGQQKISAAYDDPDMYGEHGREEVASVEEVHERMKNIHHVETALRAKHFYREGREYVIEPTGENVLGVTIVDEFTGRKMPGRRFSEGLHQAIEAKEASRYGLKRLPIKAESITLATITFQNFFRMYPILAGMTGTAVTEAEEFHKIYDLDVVVIPTNKPLIRKEYPDQIYRTEDAKFRAVVREIKELQATARPVLVGTCSVEKSEILSDMLTKNGIKHNVLNAKNHEKEAHVIERAGRPGAVTIATNMAGRGVDIILGGNPDSLDHETWQAEHDKVVEAGGLHIIGTERHEARRIDNQLRGRAGRQGDPGSSRFYVSVEDDIMRRFGGDRIGGIMERFGFDEDTPIEHSIVSKAIENTQVKVEAHHFDIRKHLLDYDDVLNTQREVIYGERGKLLSGADLKANITGMVTSAINGYIDKNLPGEEPDAWDLNTLLKEVEGILPLPQDATAQSLSMMSRAEIEEKLLDHATSLYEQREEEMGTDTMRLLERLVMLRSIDTHWREHLTVLENMRQEIGLYAYGHRDPLVTYKTEAHSRFQEMQEMIQYDIVHSIYRVSLVNQEPPKKEQKTAVPVGKKVGRNDPCPCGSGKKYKKCCGRTI
ncbi:MAG: preprotein translocase subunit SecA [Dehalococcoidia bacterium]